MAGVVGPNRGVHRRRWSGPPGDPPPPPGRPLRRPPPPPRCTLTLGESLRGSAQVDEPGQGSGDQSAGTSASAGAHPPHGVPVHSWCQGRCDAVGLSCRWRGEMASRTERHRHQSYCEHFLGTHTRTHPRACLIVMSCLQQAAPEPRPERKWGRPAGSSRVIPVLLESTTYVSTLQPTVCVWGGVT